MSDKGNGQNLKTPLSVLLDMAKKEIKTEIVSCMRINCIPPSLMAYVLKDILSDIYQMKSEQLSEDFVEMQRSISNNGNMRNNQED